MSLNHHDYENAFKEKCVVSKLNCGVFFIFNTKTRKIVFESNDENLFNLELDRFYKKIYYYGYHY